MTRGDVARVAVLCVCLIVALLVWQDWQDAQDEQREYQRREECRDVFHGDDPSSSTFRRYCLERKL